MKRTTLFAVLLVSLALSQHARSAGAESAKGPLTAAEKAQCRSQLTEFNDGVKTYNAKLDELRTLETEIELLRKEVDKEQAAVDRRDSAAMQALNARIGKNNEMVARHEQMGSVIDTMANENKSRNEQFKEACENRPLAPLPASKSQPADTVCASATGAKSVERQIEATFVELRADEKQRQAEVDRAAKARAKAQSWSEERRVKVWLDLIGSPKFMAFEREKQPYVQELMRIIVSKPKNGQDECRILQRIAAMLPTIKAINTRQYAFMASEIKSAK